MGNASKRYLDELLKEIDQEPYHTYKRTEPMGLTVSPTKNKEREKVPEGVHFGRCYGVVDIGHQNTEFAGQKKIKAQVVLLFELSHKMTDGRPFGHSKICTLSSHEKSTLHSIVHALTGKKISDSSQTEFQLQELINKVCMLQYSDNAENDYPDVNLGPAPSGTQFDPVNPNVIFDCDQPDMKVLESLPQWIIEKINARVKEGEEDIVQPQYTERNPPPVTDAPPF